MKLFKTLIFSVALLFGSFSATYAVNEVQQKVTTEYSFQSSVYIPTGLSDMSSGTPSVVDFTCDEGGTGLADQAAVNSDQVDLGVNHPTLFTVAATLEWFAAVTAGKTVDFYWSASSEAGATEGNPGESDGVDGLYAPTGFTDDEGVKQMTYIGSHINNGNQDTQTAFIAVFSPFQRYGQLVMFNNSGATLCGTDDIESSVLMTGIVNEIQ